MPDLVSLRLGKGSPLGFSLGLDLKIRILVIIRIDVWIRVVCDCESWKDNQEIFSFLCQGF